MGVEIPVGYGQLTVPFNLTGDPQEMVVTVGFRQESALGFDATATAMQGELFAEAHFAASTIGSHWSIGPCRVTEMTSLGPKDGIASGTARVGTAAIGTFPQNNAWLVQKHSVRGGRRGRGRMYFPLCNITEGQVDNVGVITGAVVASAQLAMDNWLAGCSALGLPFYLLHSNKVDPVTGEIIEFAPLPDLITSLKVQSLLATQRNRLRR